MKRVLATLCLVLISIAPCLIAQVASPTGNPPVVEAYETGSNMAWSLSLEFDVHVWTDAGWVPANARGMARKSEDQWYYQGLYPWVHWVTIGAADSVRVRVSKRAGALRVANFSKVKISPARYGIAAENLTTTSFEFVALRGQKVYCEVNEQDIDPLFVFVNPPKPTPPPTPTPADCLYYPPGFTSIGDGYQVPASVKTIYLDGGAWVSGGFDLSQVTGPISIVGPGFLVGTVLDAPSLFRPVGQPEMPDSQRLGYVLIRRDAAPYSQSAALYMDGPTLVAAPFYNVYIPTMLGRKEFRNVHMLSPWWFNTDGFLAVENADVRDCFLYQNDNKFTPEFSGGGLTVQSSVLAGRNSFQIGYGYPDPNARSLYPEFRGMDLILQRDRIPFIAKVDAPNSSVEIHDQRYSDISVSGDVLRLFDIQHVNVGWMSGGGTLALLCQADSRVRRRLACTRAEGAVRDGCCDRSSSTC